MLLASEAGDSIDVPGGVRRESILAWPMNIGRSGSLGIDGAVAVVPYMRGSRRLANLGSNGRWAMRRCIINALSTPSIPFEIKELANTREATSEGRAESPRAMRLRKVRI